MAGIGIIIKLIGAEKLTKRLTSKNTVVNQRKMESRN